MAKFKYFADLPSGETIELIRPTGMNRKVFAEKFPGTVGKNWDGVNLMVGENPEIPQVYIKGTGWVATYFAVTRKIEMKSMPSKHICDSRCVNATGRIMKCECSCGGKNHGKGVMLCMAVQLVTEIKNEKNNINELSTGIVFIW